jgi:hypothetical protein
MGLHKCFAILIVTSTALGGCTASQWHVILVGGPNWNANLGDDCGYRIKPLPMCGCDLNQPGICPAPTNGPECANPWDGR